LEEIDTLFGDEPNPGHHLESTGIGKSVAKGSLKNTADESLAMQGQAEIY
jgi:hypothetical protein